MLPPGEWPVGLWEYLRQAWGPIEKVMRLSGAGGPGAYRVTTPAGELIVKCSDKAREWSFYRTVSPALRRLGVPVPELFSAGRSGRCFWIVIEAIPDPLPRSRWEGDPAVMAALARLHGARPDLDLGPLQPFRPEWTEEMTAGAVACVTASSAGAVRSLLLRVMERSQGLFYPACLIAGDPNPTNWGVRADDSVVMFDWERFGWGTPAIDVAIAMPGLPTPDGALERRIAARYLEQWRILSPEPPAPLEQFAGEVPRAKLWSVVEFLSSFAEGRLAESSAETARWAADWLQRAPSLRWP